MSSTSVKQTTRKKQPVIPTARLDWVYKQPLSFSCKAVLLNLVRRADRDGHCFPSIDLIANDTSVCARTVKQALKIMQGCNLITITRKSIPEKRQGRSGVKNQYRLHYDHNTTSYDVKTAESLTTKVQQLPLGQKRPKCKSSTTKVQQMHCKKDKEEEPPVDVAISTVQKSRNSFVRLSVVSAETESLKEINPRGGKHDV